MSVTFQTLGDLLLRRYVTDYIVQAQNLSAPIWSMIKESSKISPTGDGAFFSVRIAGNEAGGGWRAADDNRLPTASNEQIKQHRVRPKKYLHVCEFSGLAEAVSRRGGEEVFANAVTDALSSATKRASANFETTFLRGDGTGRLTNINGAQTSQTTLNVDDARPFRTGQMVVFLNNTTGLKQAGPVQVQNRSVANATITVSSAVTVSDNDGIYISGEQSELAPPSEVTALGLPAIVSATGTIYNLSRSTYPILQSKIINASSTSLDESMLRRLRKQLLVETDIGSTGGMVLISNYDQFDRYTEISLPFRRFNDMRLDLGASMEQTSFEGKPWYLSYAALPDEVYMLKMDAIERGVVRPFSIDEKVNMAWRTGQDSFICLMKAYFENVARAPFQCAAIRSLTVPTY